MLFKKIRECFSVAVASTALLCGVAANSAIVHEKDPFGDFNYIGSLHLAVDGYDSRVTFGGGEFVDLSGPHADVSLFRSVLPGGKVKNYLKLIPKGYFQDRVGGSESIVRIKIDETILSLSVDTFLKDWGEISGVLIDVDSVVNFFMDGLPHEFTLRVSGKKGYIDYRIPDPVLREWATALRMNIHDREPRGAVPFGNPPQLVGQKVTGWAYDPKMNRRYTQEINIYRGEKLIKRIDANINDCTIRSGNACSALVSRDNLWRSGIYEFDLSDIRGASAEPIRVFAINTNPSHPPTLLGSLSLALKDDIECVYDWAEKTLSPELFSERTHTYAVGDFLARTYTSGYTVAALHGSGETFLQMQDGTVQFVGYMRDLIPAAVAQQCGR